MKLATELSEDGLRQGRIVDPYGHHWLIGTPLADEAVTGRERRGASPFSAAQRMRPIAGGKYSKPTEGSISTIPTTSLVGCCREQANGAALSTSSHCSACGWDDVSACSRRRVRVSGHGRVEA